MMTTTAIEPLLERVLAGGTLAAGERAALVASRDLLALGMAADELRHRRHGRQVTFVRVAAVDVRRAAAGNPTWDGAPGEIRLTGAPAGLAEAVAAVTAVAGAAAGVPGTGFSLDDLLHGAGGADGLAAWLRDLQQAGLAAIADAPIDRLAEPERALAAAADAGLPIARLTLDRAPGGQRDALLARAETLVAAFPAIDVFAPLPQRLDGAAPSTGYDDVQWVALARLLVPVSHIQVDWQRYGPKLAQVALTFGADDVDGVSPRDEVAEGRRRSPLEEIRRNIQAAAAEPVERTALFGRR
jgi:hypothetical protein